MMARLPKVITSSVIRGADVGDSHGGVYLIDFESEHCEQVLDWNTPAIDWTGRGGDRGLRGIAIYDERIYMAASDEFFVYDRAFKPLRSLGLPLLKHCHETFLDGSQLYITSTGYNAILVLDLGREQFVAGWRFEFAPVTRMLYARGFPARPRAKRMNLDRPQDYALVAENSLHINNVHVREGAIYFSGTRIRHLYKFEAGRVSIYGAVPKSGHNAQPYQGDTLMNDTARKQAAVLDRSGHVLQAYTVPEYPLEALERTDLPERVARQGFARGLCQTEDSLLVVGSSPATVSIFAPDQSEPIKHINISKDLRNAIHGLEIWPF